MNNQAIIVSIICDTFNHSAYIAQCLDGFLEQKTNFNYEILVHDDCSTDGTSEIVQEYAMKYPTIIKPILQSENQYKKGVSIWRTYQLPRVKGKYIALCEGDDFWTDQFKLQKQVDFLDANLSYSMCCHRYKIFETTKGIIYDDYCSLFFDVNIDSIDFDFYLNSYYWLAKTMTVVFRKTALDVDELNNISRLRDFHLLYLLNRKGKFKCLNFYGAIYNVTGLGIQSSTSNKQRYIDAFYNALDIYNYDKTFDNYVLVSNKFMYIFDYRLHSFSRSIFYLPGILYSVFRNMYYKLKFLYFYKYIRLW